MKPNTLHLDGLRELPPDWDSYGGKRISKKAIEVAEALHAVPLSDGGVQLELHAGGNELEIEIGPSGRIYSVLFEARA